MGREGGSFERNLTPPHGNRGVSPARVGKLLGCRFSAVSHRFCSLLIVRRLLVRYRRPPCSAEHSANARVIAPRNRAPGIKHSIKSDQLAQRRTGNGARSGYPRSRMPRAYSARDGQTDDGSTNGTAIASAIVERNISKPAEMLTPRRAGPRRTSTGCNAGGYWTRTISSRGPRLR